MANERLEPLAKAMRAAVTDEEKQRAWERLEAWERKEYLRMARAACEFFFGKDSGGYVIVPAEGAVGKAREAIVELTAALDWQRRAQHETQQHAMAYDDLVRLAKERGQAALRALRGGNDG